MEKNPPLGGSFHSKRYPRYNPQNEQPAMNERSSVKSNPDATASATTTAAQATDRPDLYSGTCWGGLTLAWNTDITEAIIENRNAFAKDWRLRSKSRVNVERPLSVPHPYNFDHFELYRDIDNWLVAVCSNDSDCEPPPALGMQRVAPLYCESVASFAAMYPTIHELRAKMKACNEKPRPIW